MEVWVIVKNTERYEGIDPDLPDRIACWGTKEQAQLLAERLSDRNVGCDYSWYVLNGEDLA